MTNGISVEELRAIALGHFNCVCVRVCVCVWSNTSRIGPTAETWVIETWPNVRTVDKAVMFETVNSKPTNQPVLVTLG